MENKKYVLTDETMIWNGHLLYRIKAVRTFVNNGYMVMDGYKGGWVENEYNLSQDDTCWIWEEGKVYNDAVVFGNASIREYGEVFGNTKVYGRAIIRNHSKVYDNARVSGDVILYNHSSVFGNALIYGYATLCDNAKVYDKAEVYGNARVSCDARACECSCVYGNAVIDGNANVMGNAYIMGDAYICGDAIIKSDSDYIVFKNHFSSGRYFTWTKSNDMWKVGCFHGNDNELIEKAYADGNEVGKFYEMYVKFKNDILAMEKELNKC